MSGKTETPTFQEDQAHDALVSALLRLRDNLRPFNDLWDAVNLCIKQEMNSSLGDRMEPQHESLQRPAQ